MHKQAYVLAVLVALSGTGCATDPSATRQPAEGWRCAAMDDDGNPYFYSDSRRELAARHALEACKAGSGAVGGCAIGVDGCQHFQAKE